MKLTPKRHRAQALFLVILFLPALPAALAQSPDFTLVAAPFSPDAINPGGTSSSNVTLGTLNGFNSTVDLTCTVAPLLSTGTPLCAISPTTVSPPAGAVATITTNLTSGTITPGLYTVTITGTGPTTTQSAAQNLTVLAVTPQFTVTVGTAVAPSTVHAGSGGQGTVDVNPINGYSGVVTLSCASITPLVTIPPICSFDPPVVTVNGVTVTSTIAITTVGPVAGRPSARGLNIYALWLGLPMLALTGLGSTLGGKRARSAWGLLALFILGGCLLLTPACGNNSTTSSVNPDGITPKNSYSFTLIGVDANGVTSSNTGSTTAAPTVNLTVN